MQTGEASVAEADRPSLALSQFLSMCVSGRSPCPSPFHVCVRHSRMQTGVASVAEADRPSLALPQSLSTCV